VARCLLLHIFINVSRSFMSCQTININRHLFSEPAVV
jgi:hypothetical protein